jgi:hypothetical protein
VVFDGKYMTAAGVSSGIDGALALARHIAGDEVAQAIQLGIEYAVAGERGPLRQRVFRAAAGVAGGLRQRWPRGLGSAHRRWLLAVRRVNLPGPLPVPGLMAGGGAVPGRPAGRGVPGRASGRQHLAVCPRARSCRGCRRFVTCAAPGLPALSG